MTETVNVTFVEPDGGPRIVSTSDCGQSLMELARANDVAGILADCGGACSCATCHVYIDEDWLDTVGPPDEIESDMLDMAAAVRRENSRLSCQVPLRPALDGLRVTVAPSAM